MWPFPNGSAITIEIEVVLGSWRDRMTVREVTMIRGSAFEMSEMATEFLMKMEEGRS